LAASPEIAIQLPQRSDRDVFSVFSLVVDRPTGLTTPASASAPAAREDRSGDADVRCSFLEQVGDAAAFRRRTFALDDRSVAFR